MITPLITLMSYCKTFPNIIRYNIIQLPEGITSKKKAIDRGVRLRREN